MRSEIGSGTEYNAISTQTSTLASGENLTTVTDRSYMHLFWSSELQSLLISGTGESEVSSCKSRECR